MPVGTAVGLGPCHIVLDRDQAPPKNGVGGTAAPLFGPCLLWPNWWMDHDSPWYGDRPQPRLHYVRWGPSFSPRQWHSYSHYFSAHADCGQKARWIKMPLGTEVGLGPCRTAVDGDPASLTERDTTDPSFRSTSIVAKWLD